MKIENFEGYSTLKPKTRAWVRRVVNSWQLEEHHVRLLILAGASWDRSLQAKAIVDRDGPTFKDRFSQDKPSPCIAIERDSMLTFSRLLRELGLDLETTPENRPPFRPGGY
jgi:hypothetical protein